MEYNADQLLIGVAPVLVDEERNLWGQHLIALEENRNGELGKTPSREMLNCAVIGMPSSGKTRLLETNLLLWQHSAVVVDLKGGLIASTAAYRERLGNVVVLDTLDGVGHRYNPVAATRKSAWRTLAIELVGQGDTDVGASERFWRNSAANLWVAAWYAAEDMHAPHIPYAVQVLSKDLVSCLTYFYLYHSGNPRVMRLVQGFIGEPLTLKYLQRLVDIGVPKLTGNKWGSVEESVTPFVESENLLRIFSGHDLDIASMYKTPTTVYLKADETDEEIFKIFARLVMKSLGDSLIVAGDKLSFQQRRPIWFGFDEFGTAPVQKARTWLNTMRSRGIILWLFGQDMTQMPKQSGYRDYNAARENSIHHWIVFASGYGESDTGKFISTLSGTTTVSAQGGVSTSQNLTAPNGGLSQSWSIAYRERHNVEGEDIDTWGINEAAVSVRPNGRPREFYGRTQIVNAEMLGLDANRGEPSYYPPLPEVEDYTRPDISIEDLLEAMEKPKRPQQERGRDHDRSRGRGRLEDFLQADQDDDEEDDL